jgi:hypothetical protein
LAEVYLNEPKLCSSQAQRRGSLGTSSGDAENVIDLTRVEELSAI